MDKTLEPRICHKLKVIKEQWGQIEHATPRKRRGNWCKFNMENMEH